MGNVQAAAGWALGTGLILLIHCVYLRRWEIAVQ
jgi:hypothetical protein